MTAVALEQVIFTHLGEWLPNLQSSGITDDLFRKLSNSVGKLDPYLLMATRCAFYQQIIDEQVVVTYAEAANDKGPFVHSHMVVVPVSDYVHGKWHPMAFKKHLVTYEQFKSQARSSSGLTSISADLIEPYHPSSPNSLKDPFGSQPILQDVMNAVIATLTGGDRLTLDVASTDDGLALVAAIFAILPPEMRPALSFFLNVEPPEVGRYKLIVRVVRPRIHKIDSLAGSGSASHALAIDLAQNVFADTAIEKTHEKFSEKWELVRLEDPHADVFQTVKHALPLYARSEVSSGQYLMQKARERCDEGDIDTALEVLDRLSGSGALQSAEESKVKEWRNGWTELKRRRAFLTASEPPLTTRDWQTGPELTPGLKLALDRDYIGTEGAAKLIRNVLREPLANDRKAWFLASLLQEPAPIPEFPRDVVLSSLLDVEDPYDVIIKSGVKIATILRLPHEQGSPTAGTQVTHDRIANWICRFDLDKELINIWTASAPPPSLLSQLLSDLRRMSLACPQCTKEVVSTLLEGFDNLMSVSTSLIPPFTATKKSKSPLFASAEELSAAVEKSKAFDKLGEYLQNSERKGNVDMLRNRFSQT